MRSGAAAPLALTDTENGLGPFLRRQVGRLIGLGIFGAVAFALASLGTWNVADPSLSHATDNPVTNAMGFPGAAFSDLAMQFYGLSAVAALAPAVIWGILFATARGIDRKIKRGVAWFGASLLAAGVSGCVTPPDTWPLPSGLGGVFGDMVLKIPALAIGGYPTGLVAMALAASLAIPGARACGLRLGAAVPPCDRRGDGASGPRGAGARRSRFRRGRRERRDSRARRHHALVAVGPRLRAPQAGEPPCPWRMTTIRRRPPAAGARRPSGSSSRRRRRRASALPGGRGSSRNSSRRWLPMAVVRSPRPRSSRTVISTSIRPEQPRPAGRAGPTHVQHFRSPATGAPVAPTMADRVENPAPRPAPGIRMQREARAEPIGADAFEMPSLFFLSEPKSVARDPSLSKDALEQNARMLEGVLEDFGVKGEIIHVRPGPVVTLYELEPAPGIKSSRVIGLADDIARSMSAIACRVAVVPGRNAIGIELPNAKRETVYLREILASKDFEETKSKLALALGKTINGEAVMVDIAKMPHVLVAGTTGSGKSVAINTMILSLLYRMTPQDCRLIMIDPKMLELSVYDGIPHLLTPVVTDPKKAVVALKWTVREMEDRYRKMSKVGVRNIDGFNQRVSQAEKKGERITRTVQTGFDRETGEAIYETEEMELAPLPYIVVIIDEMADLMMVAGKDIEGAVQRLAQMARAAGIHVIMATQRPSVDVITGTIKANFPTRISFQVTSKIDSRTILGEQGAEQLLGMGDMLYMAGGGRIQRVHGPFVSDGEVEKVVNHLKLQGAPEYLDAITEDDDDDEEEAGSRGGGASGGGGNFEDSDDPYDQAVAVVLRDGKASTSYIQRRLGIGYNRAASIIEKMEKEGIVGAANHAGKREILVPTEEDKM